MSKKKVFVRVCTFVNSRYYFFMTRKFLFFRGILDFYFVGKEIRSSIVKYGSYNSHSYVFYREIAQNILKYKYIERVSFYGGGIDILIEDEHKDKLSKSVVAGIVKHALNDRFNDFNIIVRERSGR